MSARTGAGLDELRAALASVATERARDDAPTRLYVDRVFTLRGIGTVATGTLWSGSIGEGDELQVGGRTIRVRSVQVHDTPGLYVLGGATFPSCPGINPTLTMWAICYRAVEGLVARLRRGDGVTG